MSIKTSKNVFFCENKQKQYWGKLKKFLENFKAKQYGKLSESKNIGGGSAKVYKVKGNMPWFLAQALGHHAKLA